MPASVPVAQLECQDAGAHTHSHADLLPLVLQGKEAQQSMWMQQTPEPDMLDGTPGSINVSSILTGKLVAKISAVAKPQTFRERRTADALTGADMARVVTELCGCKLARTL